MKRKLTLIVEDQVIEEIKIQALREKRTLSEITEDLYRRYLEERKQSKGKQKPKQ